MADFIKITINDTELGKIKGIKTKVSNLQKPMKQFMAYLELETKTQFVNQNDPDGVRWKDLAPSTWARKRSQTIGREDSIMVNSLYTRVSNLEGEIGLSAEHTIYFHGGTNRMPARTVLSVTEKRLAKGQAIFEGYLTDILR
ncbi:phage virion morphogenesis protein [Brasilonema sp. UFV-L1]|uniref:phage virion morphogenesis protein n=1 Tax=Brasilonema sp. UFV-L1 TaxID=2234130 RepID=UPI00145ED031|nr:phage virion morphogenesis protein [Brasilonema sp. UFV-L1]NMG11130.1 hypothetical protein [Brasilonema sp. UFV-L1]